MFAFVKKMFCGCETTNDNADKERQNLEKRQKEAYEQDKVVRDAVTEKQLDKGLKDSMEASDPVAKY